MDDELIDLMATKSILFSIWRAKYRMYQLYRAEWDEVENAKIAYDLAEKKYQKARKAAGLVYLIVGEM